MGKFFRGPISITLLAGTAASAWAQTPGKNDDSDTEIIVTAQKRPETIQNIPISLTAISGDDLAKDGLKGLEDLHVAVPNLNVGQQSGVALISLRGVGLGYLSAGSEGSVAVHANGVFISRSAATLSNFYDLERIEVLRGPQGTLYGRNATGGSINLIARSPTDTLSGYGVVTVGNYSRLAFNGAISGPIVDNKVGGRIAFQTDDRSGYGRNIVTGNEIDNARQRSIRATLRFTPTESVKFDLIAEYHRENDRAYGYHYLGAGGFDAQGNTITPFGQVFGGATAARRRDVANDVDPENRRRFWNVTGDGTFALDWATFRSITSYRETFYLTRADLDSTSFPLAPFTQTEDAHQFSQEFQLVGDIGRIQYLVGAYYFRETVKGGIDIPVSGALFGGPNELKAGYFGGGRLRTKALAGFGQASLEIVPKLKLTLGARYSSERKDVVDQFRFDLINPYVAGSPVVPLLQVNDKETWRSFTPKLALDYLLSNNAHVYGSISNGFKSGTYNLGGVQPPVDPEQVWAYEIGLKFRTPDRKLKANLAGFYYDYKDLQVGKVVGNILQLENAATATIYGAEAEIVAQPTADLQFTLVASYLHARFEKYISADPARPVGDGRTIDPDSDIPAFDNNGKTLPHAPDWTFSASAEYAIPSSIGDFSIRGSVSWADRVFFSPFNTTDISQPPKTKVDAFLNYASLEQNWSASIYAKNVFNGTHIGRAFVSTAVVGFPINGFYEEPRTFGIVVAFKF